MTDWDWVSFVVGFASGMATLGAMVWLVTFEGPFFMLDDPGDDEHATMHETRDTK